jgi:hypothetical protein
MYMKCDSSFYNYIARVMAASSQNRKSLKYMFCSRRYTYEQYIFFCCKFIWCWTRVLYIKHESHCLFVYYCFLYWCSVGKDILLLVYLSIARILVFFHIQLYIDFYIILINIIQFHYYASRLLKINTVHRSGKDILYFIHISLSRENMLWFPNVQSKSMIDWSKP